MHRAGPDVFGAETDGFIGPLPLNNTRSSTWPDFYADRRVLPFARAAVDRGALSTDEARTIEKACGRIEDPGETPARIHGDLWSGNIVWGADGRCWLVDAGAAHGGHRETDLAMLALFGLPHLDVMLASYDATWPLSDGWRHRVGLHQLHPLLVHAVLFGGGYGGRAAATAAQM
jgi:fructosamine-3-kinase